MLRRWFNLLHDTEIGNWLEGVPILFFCFFFWFPGRLAAIIFGKALAIVNCLLGTSET